MFDFGYGYELGESAMCDLYKQITAWKQKNENAIHTLEYLQVGARWESNQHRLERWEAKKAVVAWLDGIPTDPIVHVDAYSVVHPHTKIEAGSPALCILDTLLLFACGAKLAWSDKWNFRTSCQLEYGWRLQSTWETDRFFQAELWCPSDGEFRPRMKLVPVHIFPVALGQNFMSHIFGESADGELNRATNGHPLTCELAGYFKLHNVVVVPDLEPRPASRLPEYRILIFERLMQAEIFNEEGIKHMHGQKLVFRNKFRPRPEYLLFHCTFAMAKHNTPVTTETAGLKPFREMVDIWAGQGKDPPPHHKIRVNVGGFDFELSEAGCKGMVGRLGDGIPEEEKKRLTEGMASMDIFSDGGSDMSYDEYDYENKFQAEKQILDMEFDDQELYVSDAK